MVTRVSESKIYIKLKKISSVNEKMRSQLFKANDVVSEREVTGFNILYV